MSDKSTSVTQALDKLREAVEACCGDDNGNGNGNGGHDCLKGKYEFPEIANGPVEVVLAFNNDEFIKLLGPNRAPYFSSHGPLTDLLGEQIPGTRVATTFPVDPTKFDETGTFPPEQEQPFDKPPVDNTNTTNNGYSKQAYYFNNDQDYFVTVGPSLPKIVRTKDGGAQFWVGSIGVIAQGQGRFAGARGVATYVGSAYIPDWPEDFQGQIKVLRAGFKALIGTYVKVVLRKDQPESEEYEGQE